MHSCYYQTKLSYPLHAFVNTVVWLHILRTLIGETLVRSTVVFQIMKQTYPIHVFVYDTIVCISSI